MLFLFANEPERDAPTTSSNGVRYYGPGIQRENIDAHTGDRIYLAPGAIILGGLNLWDVEDGKVFGRGKILYNLRVPASGGYSFSVLSRDGSRLVTDDTEVAHSPATWPQVCGSLGNAVHSASGSVGLAAGMHAIRIEVTQWTG